MSADALPLFPLNTVLYPGIPLPLHVFEPRYRLLVRALLDGDGPRRFGVVAIRRGLEVGDPRPDLHDVGCVADVRQVEAHDDGRYDLVTVGGPRFVLRDTDDALPYLRGSVTYLPDPEGDDAARRLAAATEAYAGYCRALDAEETAPELPEDDPVLASYVVAAAMRLDLPDKQALLAVPDAATRLRRETALLRRETALVHATPDAVPAHGPFSLN